MKNIKTQLAVFLLGLGIIMSSCSDFLEQDSPYAAGSNTYWNNKAEAESMLAGCYNVLYSQGLYYNYYNSADPRALDGFGTNDGESGWWWWSPAELALYWKGLAPSHDLVKLVWSACYKGIARCNEVIYNVPLMGDEKIEPNDAARIIGEAKFLRAFYYNYLTSLFRDVPLSTEPTTTGYLPSSPKADVVDFITKDLKAIVESGALPNAVAEERGRATRGAAWGLLCRIYLYNEQWQEAANAAAEVMKLNYELEDDYLTLFSEAGNTSKEIIFAVMFSYTLSNGDNGMSGFLSCRNNEEYFSPILVNNNLLNEYYDIEGLPIAQSNFTNDELNDPANRDPRWGYNFKLKEDWVAGESGWELALSGRINKYQDYTVTEKAADDQDYYVIRYADILLMRAEALANSGGSQGEIEGLINQVRDRASVSMPHVTAKEITDAGGILNVIKHERRVEFAFEGHRYFDLKRWKEYEKLSEYTEATAERAKVWPIPQFEIDANKAINQAVEWGGR